MEKPSAQHFLGAFVSAYEAARRLFPDTTFAQIFTDNALWNSLILRKPGGPPAPLSASILEQTALALGLDYDAGEPLRLDAVFCPKTACPNHRFRLPLAVAVEHENQSDGFLFEEVPKLFCVRSALKAGITYSTKRTDDTPMTLHAHDLEHPRKGIVHVFDEVNGYIGDDVADYLFLVGVEEKLREVAWHALSFGATQSLRGDDLPHFQRMQA